jgi:DNA-binding response OmpR family regulator
MSTILLVDSDVDARTILRSALTHEGFRVIEAPDGDEAVRMLAEHDVRLVVGELYVRSREGDLFLPALKTHPRARDLLVMVVSTQGYSDARLAATAGGADAFFVKPCELLVMRNAVRRLLGLDGAAYAARPGRARLPLN